MPDDRDASSGPRRSWRRTAVIPLIVVVVVTLAAWWSVLRPPGWWRDAGDRSPEAVVRGVAFENAMVREVTRVRADVDPWGFVVVDADVNAWLANRLEPWLASREATEVTAILGDPRVRLVPGGLEVGIAGPLGGVVVVRFEVSIDGEGLVARPLGGGIGIVPIDADSLQSGLAALLEAVGGEASEVEALEGGGFRVPREIELVDGRRVRLDDLEVVSGELAVTFRTLRP